MASLVGHTIMIDPKTEEWVSICEFTDDNEIKFTKEYLKLTKEIGCGARKFASHLITHWAPDLQGLLDYFGPPDIEKDWYTGVDGEPMDVRDDIPELWEISGMPCEGLKAEWYRDIMRAKLISIKLPKRLINEYVKIVKKNNKRS